MSHAHTGTLAVGTVLWGRSLSLFSCSTGTSCPLIRNAPCPPLPARQTPSGSRVRRDCLFQILHTRGIMQSVCPSMAGLCHSASRPPGSSMLSHMTGFPSFLKLSNIPLYGYTTFSFPRHRFRIHVLHLHLVRLIFCPLIKKKKKSCLKPGASPVIPRHHRTEMGRRGKSTRT